MLNSMDKNSLSQLEDLLGEQHIGTSYDTPLRIDAFEISDEQKIEAISGHFREIMNILGLDLIDDRMERQVGLPKCM